MNDGGRSQQSSRMGSKGECGVDTLPSRILDKIHPKSKTRGLDSSSSAALPVQRMRGNFLWLHDVLASWPTWGPLGCFYPTRTSLSGSISRLCRSCTTRASGRRQSPTPYSFHAVVDPIGSKRKRWPEAKNDSTTTTTTRRTTGCESGPSGI